jgi:peptidoglycan hydrolase-like protein with peptidoglycan-binding domain
VTSLSGSVGRNGTNRAPDARLVQRLLNDVRVRTGQPRLAVDGIVGPKTIGAIELYQRTNGLVTDGRVDISGQTIKRLMSDHIATLEGGLIKGAVTSSDPSSPLTNQMMNDAMSEYWQALKK